MIKSFIPLFLMLSVSVYAQNSVKGTFVECGSIDFVSVYALNGVKDDFLANIEVRNGHFEYKIPDSLPSGLLMLENNNNRSNRLFFIYNRQSVEFVIQKGWSSDLVSYNTDENKLLSLYEKEANLVKEKVRMINVFMRHYPGEDNLSNAVIEQYDAIRKDLDQIVDSIHRHYPKSFISDLIKGSPVYIPSLTKPLVDQKEVHIAQFWSKFPFESTQIIRSDIIMSNVRNYFMLHIDRSLSANEQNNVFKTAIINLLSNPINNEEMQLVFYKNMHYFFLESGNTEMAYFVDKNYISNSCDAEIQIEANRRIEAYERTLAGHVAPVISGVGINDKVMTFSKKSQENPYVVVYFWASTCEHCKEMTAELKKLQATYSENNIDFMGISLDGEVQNWKNFVSTNDLNRPGWYHLHETGGWKGKTPTDFGINATPSYIILNSDWVIEKRPSNLFEINAFLSENISKNG